MSTDIPAIKTEEMAGDSAKDSLKLEESGLNIDGNEEGNKGDTKKQGAKVQTSHGYPSSSKKQGYDWLGENPDFGVVIGLRSERFNYKVTFTTFQEKLKVYALTNFKEARDMISIIESFEDPLAEIKKDEPTDLTEVEKANQVTLWFKQERVKEYLIRLKTLKNNKESLYGLIWGQCSSGLQEVLKQEEDFYKSAAVFNCVWILEKIKLVSSGIDSKSNKHANLIKALTGLCNIKQGATESNDSFRKRVDSAAVTLQLAGGDHVMCSPILIESVSKESFTPKEIAAEQDKFKAMLMVLRADPGRFGALQESLYESVFRGRDEFPQTMTNAYDLLQHISGDVTNFQRPQTEKRNGRFKMRGKGFGRFGHLSFAQRGQSTSEATPGNDGKVFSHIDCYNCGHKGHYASNCPHKKKITLGHFTLTQKQLELINKQWVLLDSCSTVSVFCNRDLVSNVEKCAPGKSITVVTNGGVQDFDHQADLKLLPLKVHFNEDSLANIVSLSDVASMPGARVTMDTDKERAILLHYNDSVVRFEECGDGLYYVNASELLNHYNKHTVTNYSEPFSFTQTVSSNKSFFTKSDIEGADRARYLQSVLGWPSDTTFQTIIQNNQLLNCKTTTDDITRAKTIYGPAIPLLKGKMIRQTPHKINILPIKIPAPILQNYPSLQLYVDFFYVNKLPFLHTKSSSINFLTIQSGKNRTANSIIQGISKVIKVYHHRGFKIDAIHGDNEFDMDKLRESILPASLYIYGKDEHVPSVERSIRSIKERVRSICHSLPYHRYTKMMTNALVEYAVHWINAFPSPQGVSEHLSPTNIITGRPKPDLSKQHIAFGSYAMVYAGTKNNMKSRSTPAIALKPTNGWGGYYFMSLLSGKRLHAYHWVEIPITEEVINRVHSLAMDESQPELVDGIPLFEWEDGNEIEFNTETTVTEIEEPSDTINHVTTSTVSDTMQEELPDLEISDDDSDSEIGDDNEELPDDLAEAHSSDDDFFADESDSFERMLVEAQQQLDKELDEVHDILNASQMTSDSKPEDASNNTSMDSVFSNLTPSIPVAHAQTEERVTNGLETDAPNLRRSARTSVATERFVPIMDGKQHMSVRHRGLLQLKKHERMKNSAKVSLFMKQARNINEHSFFQRTLNALFLSPQMSARKGIKTFGDRAIEAIVSELKQLDVGAFPGKPVVEPIEYNSLTKEELRSALEAVSLIKEKRSGKMKGRVCANGSRQRRYLKADESVASPTVSTEGLLTSFIIDAHEEREVGTFDIPGAYLHADMVHEEGKRVILVLRDEFVDYMILANPKYENYVKTIRGRKVLYLKVLRAIYGCIQSALLWYELFSNTLKDMGFVINPYDRCIANKMIGNEQCTILWYVDDAKVSHKDPNVVRQVISEIEKHFGKMDVTYGSHHEYLGMKMTLKDKKLTIDMRDQIKEIIDDFPEEISGQVSSPAAKHLYDIDETKDVLDDVKRDIFHSTTAKLLYLEKRARPDIEPTIAFLTTRVNLPSVDDWKKLKRVLTYLHCTLNELRIIGCDDLGHIFTWIDAAFAVHPNMRSQTGGVMSLGWGSLHSKSAKQKLNTKSSTEAELVGMSEYIPYNLWLINFLKHQGYEIKSNTVYQDNQSAIRMERNGRNSCTGNSRHIDIKYFFVKDRINKGEIDVSYCPTEAMLADFFTKPLQGGLFKKFRDVILGHEHISSLHSSETLKIKERVENNIKNEHGIKAVISNDSSMISQPDSNTNKNDVKIKKVTFDDEIICGATTATKCNNSSEKYMNKREP